MEKDEKQKRQEALSLLVDLAEMWWCMPMKHVNFRPGFVVGELLRPEQREILSHLKSEDMAKVRLPGV